MANWRKLDFPNELCGHNVLIKSVTANGNTKYFCGVMKRRKDSYCVVGDGTYHYFRKGTAYYYININEIL